MEVLVHLSSCVYFQFSDQASFIPLREMVKIQEPLILCSLLIEARELLLLSILKTLGEK